MIDTVAAMTAIEVVRCRLIGRGGLLEICDFTRHDFLVHIGRQRKAIAQHGNDQPDDKKVTQHGIPQVEYQWRQSIVNAPWLQRESGQGQRKVCYAADDLPTCLDQTTNPSGGTVICTDLPLRASTGAD